MLRSQLIAIASLLVLVLSTCSSDLTAQDESDKVKAAHRETLKALARILPQKHLSHHAIDDDLAQRWLDGFINKLDPRRLYFTAADVRRFAMHQRVLGDHARRGDLSFAETVRDTYVKRLRQTAEFGSELLDEQHDFTIDEQFVLRPEDFPEDVAALRDRWRRRIKYELLLERVSGLSMNDSIAKLRARFRRVMREKMSDDGEALYDLYLDAFAQSFGPHCRYLGEQTLARFR